MIRAAVLAAATLIAAPLSAKEAPWPVGIYSNVWMSEETGDLGGLEVLFYEQDGRHMVEYVLCEGWCNQTTFSELRRNRAGFAFDGVVEYFSDGQKAPETQHFVLLPKGKKFLATSGSGKERWKVGVLKAAKEPFGLAVARNEAEAAENIPE